MRYEWNPAKAASNQRKHRVSFAAVQGFEWESCVTEIDDRFDYGEERINATGFIGQSLHVLTFTMRGEVCRVISLRKATREEARRYAEA